MNANAPDRAVTREIGALRPVVGETFDRPIAGSGLAIVAVAVAFAATYLTWPLMRPTPWAFCFAAVMGCAWLGGLRPSLLATALAAVLGNIFFIEPYGALSTSRDGMIATLVFVAVSGFIGYLAAARRHSEAGERRQRRWFHAAVSSIGDAVIATDEQGLVRLMNTVAERLTGWTLAEAAGRPIEEVFRIVNEETRRPAENPALRALRDGAITGLANHTVLLGRAGDEAPIDDSAAPIRDADGAVLGVVLVFRDVAERRAAEVANERVVATLEGLTDGFWQVDRGWRFGYVNAEACRSVGRDRSDLIGRPVWQVFPAAVGTQVEAQYRRAAAERVTVEFENFYEPLGRWFGIKAFPTEGGGLAVLTRDITERKRADEEIRRLNQQLSERVGELQTLFDILPGGVWQGDPECERIVGNRAGYAMLGLPEGTNVSVTAPESRSGRGPGFKCLVDGREVPPDELPMQRAARTGRPVLDFDHDVVFDDGRVISLNCNVAPILDGEGRVRAVLGAYFDITARKRAERVLVRERELLQTIIDRIPVMLTLYEPGTRLLRLNPEFQRVTGWSSADASGVSLMEQCYPDPEYRGRVAEFMRSCRGGWMDIRMRTRDGRDVETSWANIRLSDDTLVGIGIDITDRKRAETALRESEGRLVSELAATGRLHALSSRLLSADDLATALDDVLENAIATCGADLGNIQLMNPRTGALEIAVQRGFRQDFLDHFREVRVEEGSACARALQHGERMLVEDVELDPEFAPHRRIAASAGYRAVLSTPLKTHGGRIAGILSTHFRAPHRVPERDQQLLDLYARHAADLIERLHFEQALKDADRRKDEFLATLAHELRNPLAAIRGAAQVLEKKDWPDPDLTWGREVIERQAGQMARLLDDLLDVSRITRGKLELRKGRVALAEVVDGAVETSRPLIEGGGHELEVALPDEPVYLDADPVRLAQVFSNLLNNAAKYTEPGGRIRLAAERQDGEVAVTVQDTGIGLATEMMPRLFEMFSQATPARERSQGGLGIGLSLVKGLVEMHGGTIEARSDGPGRGSAFTVRLPIADAPPSPDRRPAGAEDSCALGCKIVVADDNCDAVASLARLLEILGNEVHTAGDGQEAVEVAGAFRPDVVLLDIGMPRLNGYQAARLIREQPWGRDMVLVALTGWGQEEDKRQSREAGFDAHMTKPIDLQVLKEFLASIAPRHRAS
jgi:PAS domain S-box-containing protein